MAARIATPEPGPRTPLQDSADYSRERTHKMGGWFGNLARTVGSAGNDTANAVFANRDQASQDALNKLKLDQFGLQNKILQQNLRATPIDKEGLYQMLITRANDPKATPRDKKVYSQLAQDLSYQDPQTILQQVNKYEAEPAEKP